MSGRPGKLDKFLKSHMSPIAMLKNSYPVELTSIRGKYDRRYDDDKLDLLYIEKHGYWIYNYDTGHFLFYYDCNGYWEVKVYYKNKWTHFKVHTIMAHTACPRTPKRKIVHHIDGNKKNNDPSNLLWVTRIEHTKLHKLLSNDKSKEYWALVNKIRRQNEAYEYGFELGA